MDKLQIGVITCPKRSLSGQSFIPIHSFIFYMLSLKHPYRHSIRQLVLQARYTPRLHMASLSATVRMKDEEYKLKDLKSLDLKSGEKREVKVEGLDEAKVLLVNTGGKITALGAKCTHYGAPLLKGVLTGDGRLTCPWHGGKHSKPFNSYSIS